MVSLQDEINQLISSLGSNSSSVHDIKKVYQIDADRLQTCYRQMMEKYTGLCNAMKVEIDLNSAKFIDGI